MMMENARQDDNFARQQETEDATIFVPRGGHTTSVCRCCDEIYGFINKTDVDWAHGAKNKVGAVLRKMPWNSPDDSWALFFFFFLQCRLDRERLTMKKLKRRPDDRSAYACCFLQEAVSQRCSKGCLNRDVEEFHRLRLVPPSLMTTYCLLLFMKQKDWYWNSDCAANDWAKNCKIRAKLIEKKTWWLILTFRQRTWPKLSRKTCVFTTVVGHHL